MCKTIESAIGILLLGILITNCTFECNRKGMVSIVNNTQYTLNVFLDGSKYMTVVKNYNAPVEMTPGSHVLKVNTFIAEDKHMMLQILMEKYLNIFQGKLII